MSGQGSTQEAPVAVDPAVQMILDLLAQADGPALEDQTPDEARASFAGLAVLAGAPPEVAKVETHDADGVPVIVYWPEGDGPHPVFIWVHGGGWVIGSAAESDVTARDLCNRAGCMVVNVDYRLAPEHPFPAPYDDVVTATRWVQSTIASLGGDPKRVAIGGDSAGGNLSAAVAQSMPDAFVAQVLVYPVTDCRMDRSPSLDENAEGYLLTKAGMIWFRDHYLSGGTDPADVRVSPITALPEALSSVPPAIVITAEFDPLRDEGEAYAHAMRDAGVEVELHRYDGHIHAFFSMLGAVPAATDASDKVAAHLRRAFTT
jgi:acetyl esterase